MCVSFCNCLLIYIVFRYLKLNFLFVLNFMFSFFSFYFTLLFIYIVLLLLLSCPVLSYSVLFCPILFILFMFLLITGRTKLEPVAVIIISVVMTVASLQLVRESIEKAIGLSNGSSFMPSIDITTFVIAGCTVGETLVNL